MKSTTKKLIGKFKEQRAKLTAKGKSQNTQAKRYQVLRNSAKKAIGREGILHPMHRGKMNNRTYVKQRLGV